MHVHENVKNSAIDFIRGLLEDRHFVEPEFFVGSKRIDIAFRNLRFLGEVEPDEVRKEKDGIPQLEEYARLVLEKTGYEKIYGAVFWATDEKGSKWVVEIYEFKLEKGQIKSLRIGRGKDALKSVILQVSQDKIPLTSSNFLLLFSSLKELFHRRIEAIYREHKDNEKIKPLVLAYKNALEIIYGKEVADEKVNNLFIVHTLIQIIANAILSYILDGRIDSVEALTGKYKKYSVALPFLEWLYILYEFGEVSGEIFEELLYEIRRRILALDWSEKSRDIFRLLYEEFIEPEDRRTFGEYYTPLWLVRFMVDRIGSLKDKIVMDPFSGSGTFLDEALRRKIDEGEEPEKAIREVVGFDINPIAVMLARAELLITYRMYAKDEKYPTPLVFYINSAEFLSRKRGEMGRLFVHEERTKPVFLYNVIELADALHIGRFDYKKVKMEDLEAFEGILKYVLEEVGREKMNRLDAFRKRISKIVDNYPNLRHFFEVIDYSKLLELIDKYGDGVWAVSISSLFAVYIVRNIKTEVVLSNPPWIHLTEVKGEYGNLLRAIAKEMLKDDDPTGQVIQGGNVASVFLGGFARVGDKTFFVMPESVVYDGSAHGTGKILTLRAIEKYPYEVYRINYDAFMHGERACLVQVGEGKGKVYEIKPKEKVYKEDERTDLEIRQLGETFKESVDRVLSYFAEVNLEKALKVDKVYKKGSYIMGLFGGEGKKGKKKYAGLVVEDYVEGTPPKIRLYNTSSYIDLVETEYLKKLIYVGRVYPFYVKIERAILSDKGGGDLKNFLTQLKSSNRINPTDKPLIDELAKKLKQNKLPKLNPERWYTVYRSDRTFVAFTLKGDENTVIESHLSYIETSDPKVAYYYSGVLNYLASKIGSGVIRHQFARPLLVIIKAGLEWRNEEWQHDVARISESLHYKVKEIYKNFRAKQVKKYIRVLDKVEEWDKLKLLIDQHLTADLDEVLNIVATG